MNLVVVCLIAFLTVMCLLSVLAAVIRLLTRLFPVPVEADPTTDAATVAAIELVVASRFPGHVVTRIEPAP